MDVDEARNRMTDVARVRGFAGATAGVLVAPLQMRRIDGGYLGGVDHPSGDAAMRMHIADRRTTVEEWPAWPLDVIEERVVRSSSNDRFPPYVQAVLEESGWFPGRSVPDEVLDDFATMVAAVPQEEGALHLHPAAREKLAEFGGLALPAWRAPAIRVAPVAGHEWVAQDGDLLQQIHEQAFSVVAVGRGGEYLMAEDGWCVSITTEGDFWGGVTFEDMLTRAVSGRQMGTHFISADLGSLLADGPAA